MIVDLLLGFLDAVLTPVFSVLPSVTLPFNPYQVGAAVNGPLSALDSVVPFLDPLRGVMTIVGTTFAALLTYRVGLFLYNRVRG